MIRARPVGVSLPPVNPKHFLWREPGDSRARYAIYLCAAKARLLIALADTIDGVHAARIGLVDETTSPGAALARARKVAPRYCETRPLASELMKSAFARELESMIQMQIDLQLYTWLSQDHEEGKRAFAEKRKPRFTGR
jgi:enoyl-CoA hydratase/carnithine racemase